MILKKYPRKLVGEILVEEGVLSPEDLHKALEIQEAEGGLIGSILIRMGRISEEQLASALCKQLSLPYIQLANYRINPEAPRIIPKELAERHLFFPFEQDAMGVSLAMSNPLDREALEAIQRRVPSSRLQVFLGRVSEIKTAIDRYYGETIPQETNR